MSVLNTMLLVAHVLIGAMIIGLVMLQRGKGADAGAAFGAGASGSVFGARGSANFLSRSTAILAALFFLTSLGLTYLGAQRRAPESLLDSVAPAESAVVGPGAAPADKPASGTAPPAAGTPPAAPAPALPALPALPAGPADATKPAE